MSDPVKVKFKKLHPEAVIPQYQTDGAAGFDFHAVIDEVIPDSQPNSKGDFEPSPGRAIKVYEGSATLIPTGLAVAVPRGYELQIRPRSGLAVKQQITVLNTPGTVDSDYRGEIKVILTTSGAPKIIKHGDRIAQGVIAIVPSVSIEEVTELDETERGTGGFGSTGR